MSDTAKQPAPSRIAVAMSGGLDSTVAALLLKEQGYDVIGLTARMCDNTSFFSSEECIRDAQRIAAELDIPHFVIDLRGRFETDIVEHFVDEYARGRTPSPCPICNSRIKFGSIMNKALAMGASRLATGHYARVAKSEDGVFHLLKGTDGRKDQSYFLFGLSQEQLARCVFPLGGMTKVEAAKYAARRASSVTFQRESQDLCFVRLDEYAAFLEARRPELRKNGDLVDTAGRKLGAHHGIHRFTVGQRRGLGLATGRPMYVVRINPRENTVVLGEKSDVIRKSVLVENINWIAGKPEEELKSRVRIRYNHTAASASVKLLKDSSAAIEFDRGQFAVTPGQAAVFYRSDEVVGGGWIAA